jgi:hypothetical protein
MQSAAALNQCRLCANKQVRFAGYPVEHSATHIVICQVSTEALRALGNIAEATEDELLAKFDIYSEEIFQIASEQFDNGVHRPSVTMADLRRREV